MILIFGGTTEGKKVASYLNSKAISYIYSTKTEVEFTVPEVCQYRYGAFTKDTLSAFCLDNEIKLIIHAGHPFALNLADTIEEVATALQLLVIRFERQYPERIYHPLVHYLSSYEEILVWLSTRNINTLLVFTGVQSITKLKEYWQQHKAYFRILPRESSLKLALEQGFNPDYLIKEMAGESLEEEKVLISRLGVQAVLTKESGESGFLSVKIQASIETGVSILILKRQPSVFPAVTTEEELGTHLQGVGYGRVIARS